MSTANFGKRLEGKVAIVTGGGGAMGGAQCRLFAEHGAAVCVADFRMDAAEADPLLTLPRTVAAPSPTSWMSVMKKDGPTASAQLKTRSDR